MERQKKQAGLTREEIEEMIKELEPGTMMVLEMPDIPEAVSGIEKEGGGGIYGRTI